MIYEPRLTFNVYLALGQGLVQALQLAAVDFISGENKPWAYYLGAFFGYSVAATGIPGATATFYVIGETLDVVLLHSQEGSDVKLYLDGVEAAAIDTFIPDPVSQFVTTVVALSGLMQRVDIVNSPSTNGDKTSTVNWLAIAPGTVNGGAAQGVSGLANYNTLKYHITDAETPTRESVVPVGLPIGMTIAQMQTYADGLAPLLDDITEGVIARMTVEIALTDTAGLKSAPSTNALNERGGLLSALTTGVRGESLWIPAINHVVAPGEGLFSIAQADVAALTAYLVSAQATFRALTPQGYNWSQFRRGKRSVRK